MILSQNANFRALLRAGTVSSVLAIHGAAAADPVSPPMEPERAASLPWTQAAGQGVALGVEVFGAATAIAAQGAVAVPLGKLFAIRGRVMLMDGFADADGASLGFKLEPMLRSPVLLNLVRVYAGGGPAIFYGLSGTNARQVDGNWFHGDIDGNWFAGAEVFFDARWALHWEMGTSGGAFASGSGAYTNVGINAYLF